MNTRERLDTLCRCYGLGTGGYPSHSLLDALDKKAGIDTTGGRIRRQGYVWDKTIRSHSINYVGTRIALHENNLKPPYFWLGACANEGERA